MKTTSLVLHFQKVSVGVEEDCPVVRTLLNNRLEQSGENSHVVASKPLLEFTIENVGNVVTHINRCGRALGVTIGGRYVVSL